jgi:hypothetical protein
MDIGVCKVQGLSCGGAGVMEVIVLVIKMLAATELPIDALSLRGINVTIW